MLDLRAIRRDPEPVRAALARRARRLRRAARRARWSSTSAPERAAPRARGAAGRAERGVRGDRRRPSAPARTRPRRSPRCRRVSARGQGARAPSSRGSRPSCRRLLALAAEPARPDRRRRGHVAARGRGAPAPAGRDHLELAGAHDRHGGAARRSSGSRFAYLQGRPGAARAGARALGAGDAARARLRAGHPAGAGRASRRCSAPASCPTPSSRSTACADDELYLVGTSEVRAGVAARRRDPRRRRCRCATPASRPASAARRAPPGKDTRGIFRVHQFDKVEMFCVRRAGALGATSTSGCSRSRRRSSRALGDPLPRGQHRRRRPRQLGAPRSTTARRGCPARSATAS